MTFSITKCCCFKQFKLFQVSIRIIDGFMDALAKIWVLFVENAVHEGPNTIQIELEVEPQLSTSQ